MVGRLLTAGGFDHYEISNYAKPGYQSRHNSAYWNRQPFFGFGLGATSMFDGLRFVRPKTMREYIEYVELLEGRETLLATMQHAATKFSDASLQVDTDILDNVVKPTGISPDKLITQRDRLQEFVMLRLRLQDGLPLNIIHEQFGRTAVEAILRGATNALFDRRATLSRSPCSTGCDRRQVAELCEAHHQHPVQVAENIIRSGSSKYDGDPICLQQINNLDNSSWHLKLTDPRGFLLSNDVISDIFVAIDRDFKDEPD